MFYLFPVELVFDFYFVYMVVRSLKKHQWIGDLDNYSRNPANCFPPAVLQMSWRHLPHSSLLFSHFFHFFFLLHRIFITDLTWNLFLNTCIQNKYIFLLKIIYMYCFTSEGSLVIKATWGGVGCVCVCVCVYLTKPTLWKTMKLRGEKLLNT